MDLLKTLDEHTTLYGSDKELLVGSQEKKWFIRSSIDKRSKITYIEDGKRIIIDTKNKTVEIQIGEIKINVTENKVEAFIITYEILDPDKKN